MNFELFFSISAFRSSCNFHARTCMKAHEMSPQIYGYINYSTNSPACQPVFSINFHIAFINPRLCEARPAEKPFFQGEFYGAGQGQNARRGRKGCKKYYSDPFHGVDRSACPGARIGDLPSVSRRVPILIYCEPRHEQKNPKAVAVGFYSDTRILQIYMPSFWISPYCITRV